jgi:hypothetical protein
MADAANNANAPASASPAAASVPRSPAKPANVANTPDTVSAAAALPGWRHGSHLRTAVLQERRDDIRQITADIIIDGTS